MLEARDLACAIPGRTLWRDVQLTLRAGESWAVTGASGTGKTLFLRALAGLRRADVGELRLEGRPMSAWWMPAWRAQVVYVAQRPALPDGTVRAALAAPFALRVHRQRPFPADRAAACVTTLGLSRQFLDQATTDLSGGEAQIAALVRALLIEPRVLLLDEPTSSLDPDRTRRVEALLRAWLRDGTGHACVWTSHDHAQLERTCSNVLPLARA